MRDFDDVGTFDIDDIVELEEDHEGTSNEITARECGEPGVCECEEYRCTIESTCVCPQTMIRLDLPNTGKIGGDICYGCRPRDVFVDVSNNNADMSRLDFDDDDDDDDTNIFDNDDIFELEEDSEDTVDSVMRRQCGGPGVCDCEDFRCTIESTCVCPMDMVRLELPNTGAIGGDICYACRKHDAHAIPYELQMDYDDDDDEDVNNIFGEKGDDDFDEDDDEGEDAFDIFADDHTVDLEEENDNIIDTVMQRECGGPGVCDCEEFRCTIESACVCPLGMVRLKLPNTGPIGGEFCYGCRFEEIPDSEPQPVEKETAMPIWFAVLLLVLLLLFFMRWNSKLNAAKSQHRTPKRKRQRKQNR